MKQDGPRCARCGTLDDLLAWPTGASYCVGCRFCRHAFPSRGRHYAHVNRVCLHCLRLLHTQWTFPRVRDLAAYVQQAYEEYGIDAGRLLAWSDEGYDRIAVVFQGPRPAIRAPPPHHRLG